MEGAHAATQHPSAGQAGAPGPGRWLGAGVGLGCFVAVLLLASMFRQGEERALAEATATALRNTASEISHHLVSELRGLLHMARRWERLRGIERAEWEAEARDLLAAAPELQALEYLDASLATRWGVSVEGPGSAPHVELAADARLQAQLAAARDARAARVSHALDLRDGRRGFLLFAPLFPDDRFDGLLVAVYRAGPLLEQVLNSVAPGHAIRVHDAGLELWRRGPDDGSPRDRRQMEIPVRGVVWTAEVTPGAEVVAMYRSRIPGVLAVGGALFGLAIGSSFQLSRTWRWRNASLRREMAARAQAEAAERGLREELSSVLSSLPDHLWSAQWRPETGFRMRYYSPGTDRISGRDRATFERDPGRWAEAVHPEDRREVMGAYMAFFAGQHDQLSLEYRLLRPDGTVRWVRDRVRATPEDGGRRLDGILSDITRLKRDEAERIALEASVQQSRRLESLGVLAGGIAHDFNNLLVGVLGHARLLLKELPEDSPLRSSLHSIEKSARRAAELCRQLLAYAGQGHFELERVDLREVAREMEQLLGTWLSTKVDLRHDFADPLPAVEADPSQMRQVVMNLLTNASEAVGEAGGRIGVSLRPASLDRAALSELDFAEGAEPGEYVALGVRDDGEGMDEETRQHLFEPFYSTKFAGRGLGMAAVLGITRTHRGGLRVESAPGRGTSVTVLIPASHRPAEPSAPEPAPDAAWRGSGSVLLVDDDDDARELGAIVLERAGFSVLPAASGLEALKLFERRGDEIRCVLLDLTMPELDGAETLRRLRDRGSEVPVVLFSGYREATAVERFKGLGLAAFLEKPFTPESLVDAVRRALGEG